MKLKIVALLILITGAVTAGVIRTGSTVQKEPPPLNDRLKWYAKEAKSQGRQKVNIPADLTQYLGDAGTITAEEAFSSSNVIIAHLVAKQSYSRSDDIVTWNKFAIDEVLSEAKELPCKTCGPSEPPSSFLPLQSGEFLIAKAGGRAVIDGVEIEQYDQDYPEYEFDQKYLFLIVLNPSGTAWTMGGPVGVFRILHDDKVIPIRDSDHMIRKDFKTKFHNSIARLREHLKHK